MIWFVRYFIVLLARKWDWKRVCEIGAFKGASTDEFLKLPITSYTIVDPCLDADLALKYAGDARVTVRKCNSVDALPDLQGTYDCILVDGDHNWYTVISELRLIQQRSLLRPGGIAFFHDVEWPYGRRDMYYQPNTIPPEYRQEYESKGIIRGRSQLADNGGLNQEFCNAVREGGPRNGVLTAIEDFVAERPSEYVFSRIRAQYGLGILQRRSNLPSEDRAFYSLRIIAGVYSAIGSAAFSLKHALGK